MYFSLKVGICFRNVNFEMSEQAKSADVECPVCAQKFSPGEVEEHVNRCLFLKSPSTQQNPISPATMKRSASTGQMFLTQRSKKHKSKKADDNAISHKTDCDVISRMLTQQDLKTQNPETSLKPGSNQNVSSIPLAEMVRPTTLETFVGQKHVLGERQMLRELLERGEVSSLILWGPPGCGKTSLANVIAGVCKQHLSLRFVKLSATMAGIADVKEVVTQAKNTLQLSKRRTVLFMDEIHRFNKLQQDAFLPHVESGAITLIGATTENPSFSLNAALLSRCRVIILEKLPVEDVMVILKRALESVKCAVTVDNKALRWLAEVCDGDARVALGGLQMALQAVPSSRSPTTLMLEDIQEGLKRSHITYARGGDSHYDMISALHKSVRASDDNAALYWLARMLQAGEDPVYIARRLVRAASEDIGLADSRALPLAVACMEGCTRIGAPECDVLLAHCAVYLARASKSQEVYHALLAARKNVDSHRGPLPPVPLHLRNAPTRLLKEMGAGLGYNTRHKSESGLHYMPEGMLDVTFFGKG